MFRLLYHNLKFISISFSANSNITHVDIQKLIECGANGFWFKTIQSTTGEKVRLIGKVDKAVQKLAVKHGLIDWPVITCIELKTCIVNTGLIEGVCSLRTAVLRSTLIFMLY